MQHVAVFDVLFDHQHHLLRRRVNHGVIGQGRQRTVVVEQRIALRLSHAAFPRRAVPAVEARMSVRKRSPELGVVRRRLALNRTHQLDLQPNCAVGTCDLQDVALKAGALGEGPTKRLSKALPDVDRTTAARLVQSGHAPNHQKENDEEGQAKKLGNQGNPTTTVHGRGIRQNRPTLPYLFVALKTSDIASRQMVRS